MMQVRNHTPHPLDLYLDGVVALTWPPAGAPVVRTTTEKPGDPLDVDGVRVSVRVSSYVGDVGPLPESDASSIVVVSQISAAEIARRFPERRDVYYPSPLVRDDAGQVIGCAGLARFEAADDVL